MKRKKKQRALWVTAGILALFSLVFFVLAFGLSTRLLSQQEARRWQGESELEFCQVSCFLPVDEKLQPVKIYAFREAVQKALHEASVDVTYQGQLQVDACIQQRTDSNHLRSHRAFTVCRSPSPYPVTVDLSAERIIIPAVTDLHGIQMTVKSDPLAGFASPGNGKHISVAVYGTLKSQLQAIIIDIFRKTRLISAYTGNLHHLRHQSQHFIFSVIDRL